MSLGTKVDVMSWLLKRREKLEQGGGGLFCPLHLLCGYAFFHERFLSS